MQVDTRRLGWLYPIWKDVLKELKPRSKDVLIRDYE